MFMTSRILYVEDDRDSCEMLGTMMSLYSDWKFSITAADSADAALPLMEKQAFDFYILGYKLPGISGVELCERIGSVDSETPIVFYTGLSPTADRLQALKAGANEFLVKPNNLIKLTETVKNLLCKKQSVAA